MKKLKDFVLIRINGLLGERLLIWASSIKLLAKRIKSKFSNKETANDQLYVDLGLPSGLKWAKCNVGAKKETDYGYYFMWGSTTPNTKTECNWVNAPFNNGLSDYDAEYFNTHKSEWLDSKDNLKPEYDAAYKATNGIARMPTHEDFQELLDNTDNEWIENFNGIGVNGYKFTSKIDASKYIFIPAAGSCNGGSVNYVGGIGYVWSSSLSTSYTDNAWYLYFLSDGCGVYNYYRYYGKSVRGVMD